MKSSDSVKGRCDGYAAGAGYGAGCCCCGGQGSVSVQNCNSYATGAGYGAGCFKNERCFFEKDMIERNLKLTMNKL
ncbi:MAG: hypothetical protein IPI04_12875 [Ignavibacteria bacterium]|nr:hypothetical protein [Ignavibacteria bacterium]